MTDEEVQSGVLIDPADLEADDDLELDTDDEKGDRDDPEDAE